MAQKNYPDIQTKQGDAIVTNSVQGFKVVRKFIVDQADMTDPTSTLYSLLTSGDMNPANPLSDVPVRMTPHPTIIIGSAWADYYFNLGTFGINTCMCADILTARAITSTQAEIEVEYAVLNAMTQEPSSDGDAAPALLQIGSSVQTQKVAQDCFGQPIVVPYLASGGVTGSYSILPTGIGGDEISDPSIKITSDVQFPALSFRFMRRETVPRDGSDYVGVINSSSWTINGKAYPQHTILCTRIESETQDNGLSYIVTYEFLYKPYLDVPTGSNFVSPAVDQGSDEASPWDLIAYYVLPTGVGLDNTSALAFGPNEMPPDAVPSIFALYNDIDFNSFLHLT